MKIEWLRPSALLLALMGTQVEAAGLAPHFQGRFGAIEIYDSQAKLSFRVNPPRLTTALPVCATGHLAIAVAALKQGILKPDATERAWDPLKYPAGADWSAGWQQPQTLASALRNGAPWYFEQLQSELGPALVTQLQRLKLKFASAPLGEWRLSTLDQVEWLKAVRANSAGLAPAAHTAILSAMQRGQLDGHTLYGVGGRCPQDAEYWLGWQIGWVERAQAPVFYALNTEGNDRADLSGVTRRIARDALAEMKFWPQPLPEVAVPEAVMAGGELTPATVDPAVAAKPAQATVLRAPD